MSAWIPFSAGPGVVLLIYQFLIWLIVLSPLLKLKFRPSRIISNIRELRVRFCGPLL